MCLLLPVLPLLDSTIQCTTTHTTGSAAGRALTASPLDVRASGPRDLCFSRGIHRPADNIDDDLRGSGTAQPD